MNEITLEKESIINNENDILDNNINDSSSNSPNKKSEHNDLFGDDSDEEIEEKPVTIISPQIIKSSLERSLDEDTDAPYLEEPYNNENGDGSEKMGEVQDELDDLLSGATSNILQTNISKPKLISKLCIPELQKVSNGTKIVMKTPNFVKIQMSAYNKNNHIREIEEDMFGNATSLIRWRQKCDENGIVLLNSDGTPQMESNARVIRWSDGSHQLVVGKAVFNSNLHPLENSYAYAQHRSAPHPDFPDDRDIKLEPCLEYAGKVDCRIVIQPISLDDEMHTRTSLKIQDKYKKTQKISIRDYETISIEPEKEHDSRAKDDDEKLRKERKLLEKNRGDGYVYRSNSRRPSMTASYLTEGDDSQYDSVNISDLKARKSYKKPKNRNIDSDDSEDEDEDEDDTYIDGEMDDFISKSDDDNQDSEAEYDGGKTSKNSSKSKKNVKIDDDEDDDEEEDQTEESEDDDESENESDEEVKISKKDKKNSKKDKSSSKSKRSSKEIIDSDEENEMIQEVQQKKRVKRTVIDSDDEDS